MGDEAFEALWRAQFQAVARTATAITGSSQDGVDLAQEAFARAYQHWRKVSRMERPDAWVHRVAVNLAISQQRRSRLGHRPLDARHVDGPEPPDEELLASLQSLSPSQRAVICLRFYLDWSVDEVAEALHKRPGTVRALTHQGMQRLRADLKKEPQDE
jgi:RNA polymerase sigma-70 factor (ECF subfamily)